MPGVSRHRRVPALMLGMAAALLGGCTVPAPPPMTAADYAAMQETLAQSAAARGHLEQTCREDARSRTEDERAAIGAILDVDRDQVDQVFCARLVAAIARSDVSYEDFTAMQRGSSDPELMRRLLRALRRAPGQYAI